MDQTQTQRYVSRFEPLALHPRLHHREGFPIHYLPRGNLHRGGFVTTQGVPNSSLNTNTTSHKRGRPVAKQPQSPLPKRDTNQTPPLTRGSKPTILNLYQRRGNPTMKRVFTTSGFFQPQTISLFPQNKILIE